MSNKISFSRNNYLKKKTPVNRCSISIIIKCLTVKGGFNFAVDIYNFVGNEFFGFVQSLNTILYGLIFVVYYYLRITYQAYEI